MRNNRKVATDSQINPIIYFTGLLKHVVINKKAPAIAGAPFKNSENSSLVRRTQIKF